MLMMSSTDVVTSLLLLLPTAQGLNMLTVTYAALLKALAQSQALL